MYREVTMIEFKALAGAGAQETLGLDPKTVRHYLSAAEAAGLPAQMETFSNGQVGIYCCRSRAVGGPARTGPVVANNGRSFSGGWHKD